MPPVVRKEVNVHRKCGVIFCGNEHGTGDVTYPDLEQMSTSQIVQRFVDSPPESLTRREAKAAGWRRVNGEDYCPMCVESGI
jgi:hypothetical protein